ncbi:MAG TPA: ABC transporter permease [Gaiellaceae bacterium]|nr:ABC transporter permease [Gaiellaceae bacterium]
MRNDLLIYIVRRLFVGLLVLVILSFAVFVLLFISPGNVVDVLLGAAPRTPQTVANLRHQFHLDKPFLVQYWIWLRDAVQLHFGTSNVTQANVVTELQRRLPISMFLGFYAYLITLLLGIIPGVIAALKNTKNMGRLVVASSIVALCAPAFVTGVFLLFLFAVVWHLFPIAGAGDPAFVDRLWHLTLPALALALPAAAFVLRHTRASVLTVMNQDYVTFARARGLGWRRIVLTYTLRNALIPVVTASGLMLAFLITGAVLVETTFSVPGIGLLLVTSAQVKDLPMLQGLCVVVAIIVIVANLLADILYALIDPRIRLGRKTA